MLQNVIKDQQILILFVRNIFLLIGNILLVINIFLLIRNILLVRNIFLFKTHSAGDSPFLTPIYEKDPAPICENVMMHLLVHYFLLL